MDMVKPTEVVWGVERNVKKLIESLIIMVE